MSSPHANAIWNWKQNESGANMINVSKRDLVLTLLPRTTGKFTRYGLKANKLRYHADGYKEQYLYGEDAIVAYNPDNCSKVWVKEKDGAFVEFALIESRFTDMPLVEVQATQQKQKALVQDSMKDSYQAKIELMSFIEAVSAEKKAHGDVQIKETRSVRKSVTRRQHKDIGGVIDDWHIEVYARDDNGAGIG